MSCAAANRRRVVLVTGMSGAGRSSILRTLEDLGYQTVDNLPLGLIGEVVQRDSDPVAIGVDARSRDFSAAGLAAMLEDLRRAPETDADLVFAWASHDALLRRYTETRRRHPLASTGRVIDGIVAEAAMMSGLREVADVLVDTTDLPARSLRALIEGRFGIGDTRSGMTVTLLSFAFPAGLPRDADLVFDARFLRNPHYRPELRALTGLHDRVRHFIEEDPDYPTFFAKLVDMLSFLLPRFVQEGKRYVTVAVGCTGGRHRSVEVVERLAGRLGGEGWRVSRTHRELARDGSAAAIPGDVVAATAAVTPAEPVLKA